MRTQRLGSAQLSPEGHCSRASKKIRSQALLRCSQPLAHPLYFIHLATHLIYTITSHTLAKIANVASKRTQIEIFGFPAKFSLFALLCASLALASSTSVEASSFIINGGPGQALVFYGTESAVSFDLDQVFVLPDASLSLEFWVSPRCTYLSCTFFTLRTNDSQTYVSKRDFDNFLKSWFQLLVKTALFSPQWQPSAQFAS